MHQQNSVAIAGTEWYNYQVLIIIYYKLSKSAPPRHKSDLEQITSEQLIYYISASAVLILPNPHWWGTSVKYGHHHMIKVRNHIIQIQQHSNFWKTKTWVWHWYEKKLYKYNYTHITINTYALAWIRHDMVLNNKYTKDCGQQYIMDTSII